MIDAGTFVQVYSSYPCMIEKFPVLYSDRRYYRPHHCPLHIKTLQSLYQHNIGRKLMSTS